MERKAEEIPMASSESEEAAWYSTAEGRRQTQREFDRALQDGTISRSPGLEIPKSDPEFLAKLIHDAEHR